jgi:hypothetical protein
MQTFFLPLLACLLVGCATTNTTTTSPTATQSMGSVEIRPLETYHLHLPGIGGTSFVHEWWCHEIRAAGPTTRSELYDWTGRRWPITVLQSVERNRVESKKVAEQIVALRRAHPDARIVISSESGGAGPTVWALEDLPDDVFVDAVVLIAPALSPDYDLSAALRHVRGNCHAFISADDNFILDWGTRTYGTIDGKNVDAAGHCGFVTPAGADEVEYAKLVQVPHRSAWAKYWNFGGHGGAMSPAFAKHVIAPLIARGEIPG